MRKMTIEINLNELGRVQYLTEVLPEIPTNTILYKKLTGLGATVVSCADAFRGIPGLRISVLTLALAGES